MKRTGPRLFDAVLAAPTAAAPLEVYADWLAEQGDGRAEYARLQLRLREARNAERPALLASLRRAYPAEHPAWLGRLEQAGAFCADLLDLGPFREEPPLPVERFEGTFGWLRTPPDGPVGLGTDWARLLQQLEALGYQVPAAFRVLMTDLDLQRRVPSSTDAYFLDAGRVPEVLLPDGARLVLFHVDSQWTGGEAIRLATDDRYAPVLSICDLNAMTGLGSTAPTVEAWLYRTWLTERTWFARESHEPGDRRRLTAEERAYVRHEEAASRRIGGWVDGRTRLAWRVLLELAAEGALGDRRVADPDPPKGDRVSAWLRAAGGDPQDPFAQSLADLSSEEDGELALWWDPAVRQPAVVGFSDGRGTLVAPDLESFVIRLGREGFVPAGGRWSVHAPRVAEAARAAGLEEAPDRAVAAFEWLMERLLPSEVDERRVLVERGCCVRAVARNRYEVLRGVLLGDPDDLALARRHLGEQYGTDWLSRGMLAPDTFEAIATPAAVGIGVQLTVGRGPLRLFEISDRDIVWEVNGRVVLTGDDLLAALRAAAGTDAIVLGMMRRVGREQLRMGKRIAVW